MKKIRKIAIILILIVLSSAMLISCAKEKATPEESAKIFLDVTFKNDKTNISKIGLTEKDYDSFRKEIENGIMQGIAEGDIDSSIMTDEIKNNLKADLIKGFSKIDYKVNPISTDKNTAEVEVKVRGFDMKKIFDDSTKKVQEEVNKNPSITEKEIYQSVFKLMGEEIAKGTLVQEPKSVDVTLTKKGNVWLPESEKNYSEDILSAIMPE